MYSCRIDINRACDLCLVFLQVPNYFGWPKFCWPDQKLTYIFCQSQTFCATPKNDFHSTNFVFEEALNAIKFFDWLKNLNRQKTLWTCRRTRHKMGTYFGWFWNIQTRKLSSQTGWNRISYSISTITLQIKHFSEKHFRKQSYSF